MSLEFALRDFLRTRTGLMSQLNGEPARLDLDFKGTLASTHLTFYRAGGSQHDYMPLETALISFHCYGSTRRAASDVAEALAVELRALYQRSLNASVTARSATVEGVTWLPAADGTARYVVTASVTAAIAAPAA